MDRSSSEPAWRTWARVGLEGIGGPGVQLKLIYDARRRRGWRDDEEAEADLGLCTLLPGPEAMQFAALSGFRDGGLRGGLTAGTWFILPGFLVLLGLAYLYQADAQARSGWELVLPSLRLAAVGVLGVAALQLLLRAGRRVQQQALALVLGVGALLAGLPIPAVVLIVAMVGLCSAGRDEARVATQRPLFWQTALILSIGAVAWLAPIAAVCLLWPPLAATAWPLLLAALLGFGGAYAVLAIAANQFQATGALELTPTVDAIAIAEVTPGPLVQALQFMGSIALHDTYATWGILVGALLATWILFVPSFLLVFAFAPWAPRLQSMTHLRSLFQAAGLLVPILVAYLAASMAVVAFGATVIPAYVQLLIVGLAALLSVRWNPLVGVVVPTMLVALAKRLL